MIYNLTQHAPTPEQVAAGVVELPEAARDWVRQQLTFDHLPSSEDLSSRADRIVGVLLDFLPVDSRVMIGGAPFFMEPLAQALRHHELVPVYAFSVRESVDEPQPDGSVRKVAVFRHGGFIE